jgi:hypothetical protein
MFQGFGQTFARGRASRDRSLEGTLSLGKRMTDAALNRRPSVACTTKVRELQKFDSEITPCCNLLITQENFCGRVLGTISATG